MGDRVLFFFGLSVLSVTALNARSWLIPASYFPPVPITIKFGKIPTFLHLHFCHPFCHPSFKTRGPVKITVFFSCFSLARGFKDLILGIPKFEKFCNTLVPRLTIGTYSNVYGPSSKSSFLREEYGMFFLQIFFFVKENER